jgi:hypothetical protein
MQPARRPHRATHCHPRRVDAAHVVPLEVLVRTRACRGEPGAAALQPAPRFALIEIQALRDLEQIAVGRYAQQGERVSHGPRAVDEVDQVGMGVAGRGLDRSGPDRIPQSEGEPSDGEVFRRCRGVIFGGVVLAHCIGIGVDRDPVGRDPRGFQKVPALTLQRRDAPAQGLNLGLPGASVIVLRRLERHAGLTERPHVGSPALDLPHVKHAEVERLDSRKRCCELTRRLTPIPARPAEKFQQRIDGDLLVIEVGQARATRQVSDHLAGGQVVITPESGFETAVVAFGEPVVQQPVQLRQRRVHQYTERSRKERYGIDNALRLSERQDVADSTSGIDRLGGHPRECSPDVRRFAVEAH